MAVYPYFRENAAAYARRWAFDRNPKFYNFTGQGGDCTNFVSQCVYAGSCRMDFSNPYGWYYRSLNDRAPAWTGVVFFYNYLTRGRESPGPYASEVGAGDLMLGDVIQLARSDGRYYHTLIVTGFAPDSYLVAAHSNDALDRPLNTYTYAKARFLHILGVRSPERPRLCFSEMLMG